MDKRKSTCWKWIWGAVILMIFVVFFLLNHFTPYLADDYSYAMHFKWGTNEKMTSFMNFLDSLKYFYGHWGGRIFGYSFMVLASYLSMDLFDLINTLLYLLMTYLVYAICNAGRSHNLVLYLFIHLLLWILVPDYGQVMFWQSGSANYLWISIPILVMLWIYRKNAVVEGGFMKSRYFCIPMLLIGMIAGIAMENMSAGLLVIIFLSLFYCYQKNKMFYPYVFGFVGALIGFSILFFAPGNRMRAESEERLSLLFKFFIVNYYWIMIFGGISVVWLILFSKEIKKYRKEHCLSEQCVTSTIYVIAAVCAAYCLVAANSIAERALFIVAVYLIIAVCILGVEWLEKLKKKYNREILIVCMGAVIYFLVSACDTLICSRQIYMQTQERESYILEQKRAGITEIKTPVISIVYPFRSKHDALEGLSDIHQDPDYWINVELADYYGVDRIQGYYEE